MAVDAGVIAREFAISEEELLRKSLRAFLLQQLHILEAERKARCAKFGVADLEGMDQLLFEGKVSEEDILEDFQEVDYLIDRAEKIKALLREV